MEIWMGAMTTSLFQGGLGGLKGQLLRHLSMHPSRDHGKEWQYECELQADADDIALLPGRTSSAPLPWEPDFHFLFCNDDTTSSRTLIHWLSQMRQGKQPNTVDVRLAGCHTTVYPQPKGGAKGRHRIWWSAYRLSRQSRFALALAVQVCTCYTQYVDTQGRTDYSIGQKGVVGCNWIGRKFPRLMGPPCRNKWARTQIQIRGSSLTTQPTKSAWEGGCPSPELVDNLRQQTFKAARLGCVARAFPEVERTPPPLTPEYLHLSSVGSVNGHNGHDGQG
ncbi:hypothetical protein BGZ63DRAFT_463199 [Mariannaea sp. PMI_226]|nr:hypothetical protein BGZ63DRAFT_463199 [Mariannaea sp. PMI_226]